MKSNSVIILMLLRVASTHALAQPISPTGPLYLDVRYTNGNSVVRAYTDTHFGRGVVDICNSLANPVVQLYAGDSPGVLGHPGPTAIWTSGHITARDVDATEIAAQSFDNLSDRNSKTNVTNLNTGQILRKVATLPVYSWTFTNSLDDVHIGPMAQDFYAAFHLGSDDRHISVGDAAGVALAAIQGLKGALDRAVYEKDVEIAALKADIRALQKELRAGLADAAPSEKHDLLTKSPPVVRARKTGEDSL